MSSRGGYRKVCIPSTVLHKIQPIALATGTICVVGLLISIVPTVTNHTFMVQPTEGRYITAIHPRFVISVRNHQAETAEASLTIIPVPEMSEMTEMTTTAEPSPSHNPILDMLPTPLRPQGSAASLSTRSAGAGFSTSDYGPIPVVLVTVTETLVINPSQTFIKPSITPAPSGSSNCPSEPGLIGYSIPGGCVYPPKNNPCPFISGQVGVQEGDDCNYPALSTTIPLLPSASSPALAEASTSPASAPTPTSSMDCGVIGGKQGYPIPGGCVYPKKSELCSFISGHVGYNVGPSSPCQYPGLSTTITMQSTSFLDEPLPTPTRTRTMHCSSVEGNQGYPIPNGCIYPKTSNLCPFISGNVGVKAGPTGPCKYPAYSLAITGPIPASLSPSTAFPTQ